MKEMNNTIFTLIEQVHSFRDRIEGGHQPRNTPPSRGIVENLGTNKTVIGKEAPKHQSFKILRKARENKLYWSRI
eukprot:snap_masked-scaffold_14-processed-gene-2.26-mRNA-1 protein AED:1.00 eAED:1.00 QI:0/-1/0/0/-1/1/1/0/74